MKVLPEISKFTLERLDTTFYERAIKCQEEQKNSPETEKGCIIVGGENYGQGSSREHAALAPMYLGVRCVLVKSFARIHKANLINYGIIPVTFKNASDYDLIKCGDILEIMNISEALEKGVDFKINLNGKTIIGDNSLDERSRKILLAGGLAVYTRNGGQ